MIKMLEDKPEILTIQEVAEIFNISIQTLRRWDYSGFLKAFRASPTQQRRYKKSDVIKYLQTSPY